MLFCWCCSCLLSLTIFTQLRSLFEQAPIGIRILRFIQEESAKGQVTTFISFHVSLPCHEDFLIKFPNPIVLIFTFFYKPVVIEVYTRRKKGGVDR